MLFLLWLAEGSLLHPTFILLLFFYGTQINYLALFLIAGNNFFSSIFRFICLCVFINFFFYMFWLVPQLLSVELGFKILYLAFLNMLWLIPLLSLFISVHLAVG